MQDMKLADWLTTYKPNVINMGCLPGGEETYVKIQDVIKLTVPGTPIRLFSPERAKDGSGAIKTDYKMAGITKNELFLADLTIFINERGDIIPMRLTVKSPYVKRFVL